MAKQRSTGPDEFLDVVAPLLQIEANNSVIIGIARRLIDDPGSVDATFHIIEDDDVIAGVVVSRNATALVTDIAGADAISPVADLLAGHPGLVFIQANNPHAETIARAVSSATGGGVELMMSMGTFSLRRVEAVGSSPGVAREAGHGDRDHLIDWVTRFTQEAIPDQYAGRELSAELVDKRLDPSTSSGIMLWEHNGSVVAMSGHAGDTGSSIRVNLVYTPPEHRGHGYATALCAAQARMLLERGYQQLHLFTDLSNPTSNAIYRRIGYRQVGSCERYRLTRPE
jgi:predicted GNAT family acetyltransferase